MDDVECKTAREPAERYGEQGVSERSVEPRRCSDERPVGVSRREQLPLGAASRTVRSRRKSGRQHGQSAMS